MTTAYPNATKLADWTREFWGEPWWPDGLEWNRDRGWLLGIHADVEIAYALIFTAAVRALPSVVTHGWDNLDGYKAVITKYDTTNGDFCVLSVAIDPDPLRAVLAALRKIKDEK